MSELKAVGNWFYYFDGSGGEFYGKTTKEEMEKFLDEEKGDEAAPFPVCIPDSDGLHVYPAGEQEPVEHVSFSEIRAENGQEIQESEGDDEEENDEEEIEELSDDEVLEMALEIAEEMV